MSGDGAFPFSVRETLQRALQEDLGHGDITSLLTIPEQARSSARLIAKEEFVLAGMPFAKEIFSLVDPEVIVVALSGEGSRIRKGDLIAEISGKARSLLAGERTALNILQRISGIATATRAYVDALQGLPVSIVDTRKTTPGMRFAEKYGVRTGGGRNHRFGLYDGILIKDNHIQASGGIRQAVTRARGGHHLLKVGVEAGSGDEVREAIDAGADVIMLDNMTPPAMAEAVRLIREKNPKIVVEASGNVNLHNIREIAQTGVDIISVGALTHSARAVDISMEMVSGK